MNQPPGTTSKPLEAIKRIMDALLPVSKIQVSPPHRKFSFLPNNRQICYLIQDGCVQLHRTRDGMILHSVKAPTILGMSNQLVPGAEDFFFTTETTTIFATISASDAKNIIEINQLWSFLSIFQAFVIRQLNEHSSKLSGLSAYEITRNQLINLMTEPEEIRSNITAVQYIQDHTRLSRSGIMKMLSQLKMGGYITLDKGHLVEINDMPLKY
ncbi:winged helix-turn-helix transcriptional regulator [Yersinia proxima]|uniref:Helix-turn-helix domain-containing protein n=1 Tax=Yersinia proxima TaxID=2890316 RepID=A0ABW9F3L6_9GAMM|nr:winged helix-turn-helix transcriptional regulator [Yersinia proxima]CNK80711.1 putative DNA-binding transcriptional regulator [Yersinia intermedia]